MLRLLFWMAVFILSLGTLSIKVGYTDGLNIKFKGWPERLQDRKKGHPQ